MKRNKDYTILALAIPFFISVLSSIPSCDKNQTGCPYEVLECQNGKQYARDYQIELHMDTVWLYDGERLVGSYINTKWDTKLDSLIMKDNL